MSVDDPRPAAAQRTAAAAPSTISRRRRVATLATWFFVVPLLSFFSFTVVAGATTFDKPQTAKAVKQLPSTQHVIEIEVAKPGKTAPSAGTETNVQSVAERFSHTDHVVCSVTGSELSQIQQHYSTGRISLSVDSGTIDVVTVYGATDHDLRAYLGTPGLTCVLVQVSHVFFLPFDAHGS